MPQKVRYIQRRNSREWDEKIRAAAGPSRIGREHEYYGIPHEARADAVRRYLRTAARREGYGSRVFYERCPGRDNGCQHGGPDCRYHVKYTVFPLDEARRVMAARANSPRGSRADSR